MTRSTFVVLLVATLLALGCAKRVNPANANRNHTAICDDACQNSKFAHLGMNKVMPLKEVEFNYCRQMGYCPTNMKAVTLGAEQCTNGVVDIHQTVDGDGDYHCNNIDMMSYVSAGDLGSNGDTSDIWGATLDISGVRKDIAIVGHSDGTSFVDITDSLNPIVLGFLPTFDCGVRIPGICGLNRIWRDIKVYGDNAYIVSENWGHGLQVLNMANLYTEELAKGHARVHARETPQTLTASHHYDGFGNAHNIALNEDTGFAYIIGSNKCSGGLYVMDVAQDPPVYAGCFADDGYTHDCQCLSYVDSYPDSRFHGKEICFNYNEDTLTIVDVTNKDAMQMISRIGYKGSQYTHQGWLTTDGKFLLLDDELDEQEGTTYLSDEDTDTHGGFTRTMIWNVEDLEHPVWRETFLSEQTAIDHNLYIVGDLAFQSNYCAGLRVLDMSNGPEHMTEYAYFDLAPYCSGTAFEGTWSNYPYYDGHADNQGSQYQIVAVSSIERGLYVLRLTLPDGTPPPPM